MNDLNCRGLRPALRETVYTASAAGLVALFCASFLLLDRNFFWHDDYQTAFLPNFCDMARSLKAGELPLRSPFSWQGGAVAGEYQYGAFSGWMMACVAGTFALGLSLPLTAAVLSILHLAVLAGGAFRLARRRGLDVSEGLLVAVVAALNGWVFVWGAMNWFGHLAAVAWLPWAWWALERGTDAKGGTRRVLPAAVFLYLILAAGWPFAVLMAALLTGWIALRAGLRWSRLWPLGAAWAVGLGLSAPAWLMLLEFTAQSLRGQTPPWQVNRAGVLPVGGLLGLVFPGVVADWPHGGSSYLHRSAELAGGWVPLVLLAVTLARAGRPFLRRAGWELALAGLVLALALLPSAGMFRWSFRWLPFFYLVLAVTAGEALAFGRARGASPRLGAWAAAAVLLAWGSMFAGEWGSEAFTVRCALVMLVCAAAWVWVEHRQPPGARLRRAMPCLVTLATLWVTYARPAHYLTVPTWPTRDDSFAAGHLDPDARYLSAYRLSDVMGRRIGTGTDLCPGNFGHYGGRHLINGYSAIQPAGLTQLFGFGFHGSLEEEDIDRLLTREAGRGGLLELMGVDGLIVPRRDESFLPGLRDAGWVLSAATEEAFVLHRRGPASPRARVIEQAEWSGDRHDALRRLKERGPGPLPMLLDGGDSAALVLGRADVAVTERTRNSLTVEVTNGSPGRPVLVALSEPWYPGYVARFEGRPVRVLMLDLLVPAVLLPPGASGRLVVEYRPASFVRGCQVAAATLAVVLTLVVVGLLRGLARRGAGRFWSRPAGETHSRQREAASAKR
jgi:hypothetical protein